MLVGLPGAGKTAVGEQVARRLSAPFMDMDRTIQQRSGKSVVQIFEQDGEASFRALEAALGAEVLGSSPAAVVSTGGGFFSDPRSRRRALEVAYVVYLETSPAKAALRLVGRSDRPLLKVADPVRRMTELLSRRESGYLEAPGRVTTDRRTVDEVADEVLELARAHGGW